MRDHHPAQAHARGTINAPMLPLQQRAHVLGLVHGDRIDLTLRWWCSRCRDMVPLEHTCGLEPREHLKRVDVELGKHPDRPLARENHWLELAQSFQPPAKSSGYDVGDEHVRCKRARWWDDEPESGRRCGFILLTPSPKHMTKTTQTLDRCMGLAKGWGFGGCYIGYAFTTVVRNPLHIRSARSRKLNPETCVSEHNDDHLRRLTEQSQLTVIAWGGFKWAQPRLQELLNGVLQDKLLWAADLRDGVNPMHPLRARNYRRPVIYRRPVQLVEPSSK